MSQVMLVPSSLAKKILLALSDLEHLPRGRTLGDMVILVDELRACKPEPASTEESPGQG